MPGTICPAALVNQVCHCSGLRHCRSAVDPSAVVLQQNLALPHKDDRCTFLLTCSAPQQH